MIDAPLAPKTASAMALGRAREGARALPAIRAGIAAGVIGLLLLQLAGAVVYDESPWKLLRMVAALARGPQALEPDDEFDAGLVSLGLFLFLSLSVLYSLALAALLADAPRRFAPALGIAFGLGLYAVNFHGFTALFPWFVPYRTPDVVLVHAIFGFAAARGLSLFRRR